MSKKRIFELAKDYGLKGADLAKKLRELGFDQIRNQMSALDESELLMVQARLEIAGIIPETKAAEPAAEEKPVGIRRKRRKTADAPAEAAPAADAPAEAEAPAPAPAKRAAAAQSAAPEETPAPQPDEAAAAEDEAHAEPEVVEEEAEEPAVAEADAGADLDEAPAADGDDNETSEEEPAEAPVEAEAASEEPEPVSAAAEGESAAGAGTIPRPAVAGRTDEPRPTRQQPSRPGAKIVGRIDPALLRTSRPPAAASRSGNETITTSGAAIDVRPTLSHNRKRVLQRTDAASSRDRLSTAQLREKEQSRMRRLTGPQKGGLGQHRSGRGASGRAAANVPERRAPLTITSPVSVRSLSESLGVKLGDLVRTLFLQFKRVVKPNDTLLDEDAKLLALELGFDIDVRAAQSAEQTMSEGRREAEAAEDPSLLQSRAPVIAFLGHVDHGKTSLIDAIRKTSVASGEAGGITQHIGAYRITTPSGHPITILDTPGHQAFTEMRKRGANATDIVVLVVGADDGVMPQTEEAYAHAKAAGVPVIVALNKSDKASEQQKERTIGQLAGLGLAPESWHGTNWGGHTAIIETAATKGEGIDELVERVALEAEVLDLKANPERSAEGIVIEAAKSAQEGVVATLLVQKGTLRRGDVILAGAGYGKVRNLTDDRGESLENAEPSMPVKVTGLSELPAAGDHFVIIENLAVATKVAEERGRKLREMDRASSGRETLTLGNLFTKIKEGTAREIRVVVKCDVTGSKEVLEKEITQLAVTDETGASVQAKVIYSAVGAITEADVDLAATSEAILIGFHVLASDSVKKQAARDGVEIRTYQVVYDIVNDLKAAMEGLLSPVEREVVTGHAEVRQVFRSSKVGSIAGCMVTDGAIQRGSRVRLIREGAVIYSGKLESVRRVKEDVREVKQGMECGLKIGGYEDVKEGDIIESFETKEEKPTVV